MIRRPKNYYPVKFEQKSAKRINIAHKVKPDVSLIGKIGCFPR